MIVHKKIEHPDFELNSHWIDAKITPPNFRHPVNNAYFVASQVEETLCVHKAYGVPYTDETGSWGPVEDPADPLSHMNSKIDFWIEVPQRDPQHQEGETAMSADNFMPAITAQINALATILASASSEAHEADHLAAGGNRNGAIGTLVALETSLDTAQALVKSCLTLNRLARP